MYGTVQELFVLKSWTIKKLAVVIKKQEIIDFRARYFLRVYLEAKALSYAARSTTKVKLLSDCTYYHGLFNAFQVMRN